VPPKTPAAIAPPSPAAAGLETAAIVAAARPAAKAVLNNLSVINLVPSEVNDSESPINESHITGDLQNAGRSAIALEKTNGRNPFHHGKSLFKRYQNYIRAHCGEDEAMSQIKHCSGMKVIKA
jgi:hypothetical protein